MKQAHVTPSTVRALGLWGSALAALGLLVSANMGPSTPAAAAGAANKYIGAGKCKNCHSAEDTGNQFGVWEKAEHAKAFEVLASEEAMAVAKERGLGDPQKADECIKCHVTAHDVEPKLIKKGFKAEMGVQCESCHGPGDAHLKARFKAAAAEEQNPKLEAGEIVSMPTKETCTKCHNEESPTFKKFCFFESIGKIRHLRPGTEVPPPFECGCPDGCDCTVECPGHDKAVVSR